MIKGSYVYIRPICDSDMESIFKGCQEDEGLYMTGTRNVFTMEEVVKAYKSFSQDETRHDLAICLLENGQIIGDLSIQEIDEHNKKAMFRIALHGKDNYGKGYGTEATRLAQKFTFEELNLNRLELQVFSHNIRGIKSYEKAGFQKEGVLRQSLYLKNTYSDEIIISMLYEDYVANLRFYEEGEKNK
ncbi:GNAT family N-acetyltransferase [Virgibacillus sp. Bac332]|uniref:GNAT family N-acetyltransferase n=1 Tax=Virgibacillus sp. Bac332 TaxID=2419842 RepID=UPI000EF460CE|nr:GNAT family protein [Virgibacillus sp. Bac332]